MPRSEDGNIHSDLCNVAAKELIKNPNYTAEGIPHYSKAETTDYIARAQWYLRKIGFEWRCLISALKGS